MTTLESLLAANEPIAHKAHQLEGVKQLTSETDPTRRRLLPRVLCLFDEVGCGKTKQVVDAMQVLYTRGVIDTVVVMAPGYARSTWADDDPLIGQVALHAWPSVANIVQEYSKHHEEIEWQKDGLHWIVTNYEFMRRHERFTYLLASLRGRKTYLVCDESWMLCNFTQQTRAVRSFRNKRSQWAVLLNGTPLADGDPEDLYYQLAILDPDIIGAQNKAHFEARYLIKGGFQNRKVVGHQNLDELNAKIAPYVLSRRTRDCFDLPPMLDPITLEAKLTEPTWRLYCDMRDNMKAEWGSSVTTTQHAIVKIMRLMQITSGILGGLESAIPIGQAPLPLEPMPDYLLRRFGPQAPPTPSVPGPAQVQVSHEKLDVLRDYLTHPRPNKILVWSVFRPELNEVLEVLKTIYPPDKVGALRGKQTEDARDFAKMLLAPRSPESIGAVGGNPRAGGASLNFSGASQAIYMSRKPALIERTQSLGRIERPGATEPMQVVDIVAVGPRGQKTIDHRTLARLRAKEDMASWSVAQWRALLNEV